MTADTDRPSQIRVEEALQLMELAEKSAMCKSLEELAAQLLPSITSWLNIGGSLLYVRDERLLAPRFFQHQLIPESHSPAQKLCDRIADRGATDPVTVPYPVDGADLRLFPIHDLNQTCIGFFGLILLSDSVLPSNDLWNRYMHLLTHTVDRLAERIDSERQLAQLNTYLTVSSTLAQLLSLHEVLEIALYSCMELVSAEAASVLLLNDERTQFAFYQVEGPLKPILATATFPADKGLAGSVLATQQSELVNDVQNDPRFYRQVDIESGFVTRNLIAIPLIAGQEPVGVLEVLNKAENALFVEEERLLLLSIAEEIAFAIRNAKVFEYVVNSYCQQRRGDSCRGCERPLGSWTPCTKYREEEDAQPM